MITTIIDYGTGNLRSVQNMLKSIGVASSIARNSREIRDASRLILPGVGHFGFGMKELVQRDLIGPLNEKVLEQKTPILGICLGAQLLTRSSEEGETEGLGWVRADTRRFDATKLSADLRIPHMGWADTTFRPNSKTLNSPSELPRFYYVHSYHIVCDSEVDVLCTAVHGYTFVAGVQNANIAGVQFHPEKSHRFGKNFLRTFFQE